MSLWGHVWLRDRMTPGGWGQGGGDNGRGLRCSMLSPSCVQAAGRAVPALGGSSPFPFCAEAPERHLPFRASLRGALPTVGFLLKRNGNSSKPFHPPAFLLSLWLSPPKCPQRCLQSCSPLGAAQIPFPQLLLIPALLFSPKASSAAVAHNERSSLDGIKSRHQATQLGVTQKGLKVHRSHYQGQ